jgi:hypothetical protein
LFEEIKTLSLPGRLETTVWLIDGGGASFKSGDILMPELFRSYD